MACVACNQAQGAPRLVDLETLALGIAGKLLLWKALEQAQDSEPYFRVIDLNRLIDRANASVRRGRA